MNIITFKSSHGTAHSVIECGLMLDIGHFWIKVKVTVGFQKFSPFTAIQTVRFYNSTLAQNTELILSMYVHLF